MTRVHFRVSGADHAAVKTAAAEVAEGYAGDLEHTLTIGDVQGEYRFGKNREQGLNDGPPPRFFASCTVEVVDPDPVMRDNQPDDELRGYR